MFNKAHQEMLILFLWKKITIKASQEVTKAEIAPKTEILILLYFLYNFSGFGVNSLFPSFNFTKFEILLPTKRPI